MDSASLAAALISFSALGKAVNMPLETLDQSRFRILEW